MKSKLAMTLTVALLLPSYSVAQNANAQPSQVELETQVEPVLSENLLGSAVYRSLGRDWLYFHLYQTSDVLDKLSASHFSKLEFAVVSKRFSERKFRRFWLDTVVVEHGTDLLREKGSDFDLFFAAVQGPLRQGDFLRIELVNEGKVDEHTLFSINYSPAARLDKSFLPLLAKSLVGTHPPSIHFKQGLLGLKTEKSDKIDSYQQLKPSLSRIAKTDTWSVTPEVEAGASAAESSLIADES